MANNRVTPKYNEKHPTVIAIRKYEKEIEALEIKRDDAEEKKDWSMRHFYANQIEAKRKNMEILQEKLGTHRIVYTISD